MTAVQVVVVVATEVMAAVVVLVLVAVVVVVQVRRVAGLAVVARAFVMRFRRFEALIRSYLIRIWRLIRQWLTLIAVASVSVVCTVNVRIRCHRHRHQRRSAQRTDAPANPSHSTNADRPQERMGSREC